MSEAVFEVLILGLAVGTIIGVLSAYFADGTMPPRRWVGLIAASVLGVVGLCAYLETGLSTPLSILLALGCILYVLSVNIWGIPKLWNEEQQNICINFIIFETSSFLLLFFPSSWLLVIVWWLSGIVGSLSLLYMEWGNGIDGWGFAMIIVPCILALFMLGLGLLV